MADKAQVRTWSRSEELKRTLTVASLLSQFIDDGLTAGGLLKVLGEMADQITIGNWEEVVDSPGMVALRSAPKTARVWVDHTMSQPWAGAGGPEWWALISLRDACGVVQRALDRIHVSREAEAAPFTGLDDDHQLLELLDRANDLRRRVRFPKGGFLKGTVLEQQYVDGDHMYRLEAVVAALLLEFIETGGWKYLTRCVVCERLFLPRRTDAKTCSPRCRKRLQLDGPRR